MVVLSMRGRHEQNSAPTNLQGIASDLRAALGVVGPLR